MAQPYEGLRAGTAHFLVISSPGDDGLRHLLIVRLPPAVRRCGPISSCLGRCASRVPPHMLLEMYQTIVSCYGVEVHFLGDTPEYHLVFEARLRVELVSADETLSPR